MAFPSVVAIVASLACASAAHAMGAPDCQPEDLAPVDAWLAKQPWKAGATSPQAMVAAACRLWPFDRTALIVAAAYAQDKERDKNLVVALVDTKTMAVRSAFRGVAREDATWSVAQGSLHIDTAPYDLAPGVRAIGVDMTSDAVAGTLVREGVTATRSLFVPDGAHLRLVLDGLVLATWRQDAGSPPATSSARIALDPHRTNGFADLRITRTSTAAGTLRQEHTTIVYDGSRYAAGTTWTRHEVEPESEAQRR
ncbi:MAG TPA: hypothetical protein VIP05_07670 [Burkholderiaceae bacterium]